MEFKNNPKLGNETSEVKIRQLEDKIKTLTQNIGDLQTELNYLHNDFEAENVQVNSLPNAEVTESDKAVGYNAQGKLIPIDVTAGTAKWETVEGRANAIRPKNNAEVIVDTVLKLQNTTEETLTGSMVLSLDEAGNVIKVNMLDVVQKKLTEGYNITISADGVISCDIKTMTFKGSVSTFADLPETGNTTGDVWNVTTTNQNYCWDGENWIVVGSSVDLTNYYTKTQTDSAILSAILNKIYPVGSVKISENNVNPGTYITGTTWILKSSGRVLQGADDDHAGGTEIEAGLPNITGETKGVNAVANGAFSFGSKNGNYGSSGTNFNNVYFNAAAGETDTNGNLKTDENTKVYGKSNTVQPPAYVVYIWKRTA
ncbi:MAG: hypothetical protein MJZ11_12790 [Lachnospiraceae bacterium]|nr:hypothetical protein [Lachnospiraceae bacterium]